MKIKTLNCPICGKNPNYKIIQLGANFFECTFFCKSLLKEHLKVKHYAPNALRAYENTYYDWLNAVKGKVKK